MTAIPGQLNFPLETQLIIECSQTKLTEHQIDQIALVLRQPLDWTYIINIARRNRVLPLLSWNLLQSFNQHLSEEVKETLTDLYQNHVKHNMFLTSNLISILNLFKANNISVLPFKGPLLAIQAYGNLALRHFSDLDILIRPDQLEKAIKLLVSLDYTPFTDSHWLDNIELCLKRKKDISFISKDKRVYLELHWRLSKPYFGIPVKDEDLWQQSEMRNLGGVEVSNLSFNHLLIYLCLHGSKHGWRRLAWICDINELISAKKSDINWKQLTDEARKLGCENVLKLGLFLSHNFWGLEIPLQKWQQIGDNKTFKKMAEEICSQLFAENLIALEIGDNYANQLKLKERFKDKFKLHLYYSSRYLQIIFSPNEVDKSSFYLPTLLTPLYYIMRPFRLGSNVLFKSKNNGRSNH